MAKYSFVISCLAIALLMYCIVAEDSPASKSEDDNDSSSEETAEDSQESRRRRSAEMINAMRSDFQANSETNEAAYGGESKNINDRAVIPGLPDPATILRVVEFLQNVGEKVVPIIVEGNPAADLFSEWLNRDFQYLKSFRKQIGMIIDSTRAQ